MRAFSCNECTLLPQLRKEGAVGLTSYEETVANLQEAYKTIRKTVDLGYEISPDEAFQCECAIKDALSLLEEQDTVPPFHKCIGKLYSLVDEQHYIFCPWCGRKVKRNEND